MRNKKALAAGALMLPALALTGGIAYASTTGSHPAPARTAVTATTQPNSHHPAGQVIGHRCDWRYGDHRCDWRGHLYQAQVTQRQATQHPACRHRNHYGHQGDRGYQGRNGYSYQGGSGYQGSGQNSTGSPGGNGSGCCGHGW